MKPFSPDNSAILYLALIRKHHTNIFRFTVTLTEDICPELLQKAVDHVYKRFPTIIAGFRPGIFLYKQVPTETPPQVLPDPGLLINMTREEISQCAYRIYYHENKIIIEGFHALTDGCGMVASLSTLTAEYLHLRYDIDIPTGYPVFDIQEDPKPEELEDSYLRYQGEKPSHMPSRYSYQLPGFNPKCGPVLKESIVYPVEDLLLCARNHGVSITALVTSIMAVSIMELQAKDTGKKKYPVRIMVPIDLRKIFPSKTLRNFILYALPTMEVSEYRCSTEALAKSFSRQIQAHLKKENLSGIISYNVKTQKMLLFKLLPSALKCGIMRLAYRFFGESNSSLTMTNLGKLALPEVMYSYVDSIDLTMMPRMHSPYNCGMYSFKGNFFIELCRFPEKSALEEIFSRRLNLTVYGKDNNL